MVTWEEVAHTGSLSLRADTYYSIFYNNTKIVKFNEFKYFTNLNVFSRDMFAKCTSLKEIQLPALDLKIWHNFFSGCTSLERVIIPDGVTTLGNSIVSGCHNLKYLELPSTVTIIGDSLSYASNAVFSLVVKAVTPPSFGGFGWYKTGTTIYVPDESVTAYQTHDDWKSWASVIKPLSEYAG